MEPMAFTAPGDTYRYGCEEGAHRAQVGMTKMHIPTLLEGSIKTKKVTGPLPEAQAPRPFRLDPPPCSGFRPPDKFDGAGTNSSALSPAQPGPCNSPQLQPHLSTCLLDFSILPSSFSHDITHRLAVPDENKKVTQHHCNREHRFDLDLKIKLKRDHKIGDLRQTKQRGRAQRGGKQLEKESAYRQPSLRKRAEVRGTSSAKLKEAG